MAVGDWPGMPPLEKCLPGDLVPIRILSAALAERLAVVSWRRPRGAPDRLSYLQSRRLRKGQWASLRATFLDAAILFLDLSRPSYGWNHWTDCPGRFKAEDLARRFPGLMWDAPPGEAALSTLSVELYQGFIGAAMDLLEVMRYAPAAHLMEGTSLRSFEYRDSRKAGEHGEGLPAATENGQPVNKNLQGLATGRGFTNGTPPGGREPPWSFSFYIHVNREGSRVPGPEYGGDNKQTVPYEHEYVDAQMSQPRGMVAANRSPLPGVLYVIPTAGHYRSSRSEVLTRHESTVTRIKDGGAGVGLETVEAVDIGETGRAWYGDGLRPTLTLSGPRKSREYTTWTRQATRWSEDGQESAQDPPETGEWYGIPADDGTNYQVTDWTVPNPFEFGAIGTPLKIGPIDGHKLLPVPAPGGFALPVSPSGVMDAWALGAKFPGSGKPTGSNEGRAYINAHMYLVPVIDYAGSYVYGRLQETAN